MQRGEAQAHHTFEQDLSGVRRQVVVDELVHEIIHRFVNPPQLCDSC